MSIAWSKGRRALETELVALEGRLGTRLPEDFRAFVLSNDGAEPAPNVFRVANEIECGVNALIPLNEIESVRQRIETLPPEFSPIAWAECGNYVLLNTVDGGVWFLEHETDVRHLVASSFAEFLGIVRPFRVDDVELKPGQVKRVWIDPEFLKSLQEQAQVRRPEKPSE